MRMYGLVMVLVLLCSIFVAAEEVAVHVPATAIVEPTDTHDDTFQLIGTKELIQETIEELAKEYSSADDCVRAYLKRHPDGNLTKLKRACADQVEQFAKERAELLKEKAQQKAAAARAIAEQKKAALEAKLEEKREQLEEKLTRGHRYQTLSNAARATHERFTTLKQELLECEESCESVREEVRAAAKQLIRDKMNVIRTKLAQIEDAALKQDALNKDEVSAFALGIDEKFVALEAELSDAETKEEIKSVAKSVAALWRDAKQKAREHIATIRGMPMLSEAEHTAAREKVGAILKETFKEKLDGKVTDDTAAQALAEYLKTTGEKVLPDAFARGLREQVLADVHTQVDALKKRVAEHRASKEQLNENIAYVRDMLADWPVDTERIEFSWSDVTGDRSDLLNEEEAAELLAKLEEQLAAMGDIGALHESEFEEALADKEQMNQVLVELLKSQHDTAKAMIQNMR